MPWPPPTGLEDPDGDDTVTARINFNGLGPDMYVPMTPPHSVRTTTDEITRRRPHLANQLLLQPTIEQDTYVATLRLSGCGGNPSPPSPNTHAGLELSLIHL